MKRGVLFSVPLPSSVALEDTEVIRKYVDDHIAAFTITYLSLSEASTCPHLHQDFPGTAINKCLDCGASL